MIYKIGSSTFILLQNNRLINTSFIKTISLQKNIISYELQNYKFNGYFSGTTILASGGCNGTINSENNHIYEIKYENEQKAEKIFKTMLGMFT